MVRKTGNKVVRFENEFVMEKLNKISRRLVAVGLDLCKSDANEKAVEDINLILDDVIEAMEYVFEHDVAKFKKFS